MDIMASCPVISEKLIEALFWQQKLWYKTWSFGTMLQNLRKDEGVFLRQIPTFHKIPRNSLSRERHLGWVQIERQLRSGTDELPDQSRTMCREREEMAPVFNPVKVQPWIQAVLWHRLQEVGGLPQRITVTSFSSFLHKASPLLLDMWNVIDRWAFLSMFGHCFLNKEIGSIWCFIHVTLCCIAKDECIENWRLYKIRVTI